MNLPEDMRQEVLARLRRAEGQVRGVHSMIEQGRDCEAVVTQFAAAIRALERAGYKYFAANLAECAINPAAAEADGYTAERLEKLFMQLT